jgi:uncharacterized membrane protein YeaQ/YmgE (transglycosylase-associated protein family)
VRLVVGLIARLIVPGRHPIGILRTVLLGIAGALLGGLVYWAIFHEPGEPFSLSGNAWAGWLFSVLGAVVVLLLWTWAQGRRSWRRW